ncbi:MAG: protein-export chaperone SecB [Gammaproteobacteria bacterium]|nr:protein-export chaperone SecB [Gammaproteobacteria bacterium]
MTDEQFSRNIEIVRIVLKDLSFETPMGQDVFTGDWQPDYSLNLQLRNTQLGDDLWEVILLATVRAKVKAGVAFLIEAHEAGVFKTQGLEGKPLNRALATEAPMLIFPYLRETVDNVATKGGFPPVSLQPYDFVARYNPNDEQLSGGSGLSTSEGS